MDAAGRLVVPKALREQLQLAPGCKLEIETAGDGIRLRKAAVATALVRRHGILVHHITAHAPLDVGQFVRDERAAHASRTARAGHAVGQE